MVAACLATSTAECIGRMTTVDMSRTRSVSTAAAASVVNSSWFPNVTRSPSASVENGAASIRRHHSTVASRSTPLIMVGRVRPISTCAPDWCGLIRARGTNLTTRQTRSRPASELGRFGQLFQAEPRFGTAEVWAVEPSGSVWPTSPCVLFE